MRNVILRFLMALYVRIYIRKKCMDLIKFLTQIRFSLLPLGALGPRRQQEYDFEQRILNKMMAWNKHL